MIFKSRKKLFPVDKNFDTISQNEAFVKIRFYYAEKLLSPARTSKNKPSKMVSNGSRDVNL